MGDPAAPDGPDGPVSEVEPATPTAAAVDPSDAEADPADPADGETEDGAVDASDVEADDTEDGAADEAGDADTTESTGMGTAIKVALIVGIVAVVGLSGVVGWLGWRAYQAHELQAKRELFLEVGRQGAQNLTSIGFEHVDADVQRILDSASGTFFEQFEQRAAPYAELVKQVKSTSTGTITESGVETASESEAQVLVAVTVNTTVEGQPETGPRAFRMRIQVQDVGDGGPKVSNVEFVP